MRRLNSIFIVLPAVLGVLAGAARPAPAAEPLVGGYSEVSVTNEQVIAAARFAVKRYPALEARQVDIALVGILSARQQVVAGMNYRLRLKVKMDGELREAEAVVWWQAWNEKEPYRLTSWTWKQAVEMRVRSIHFKTKQEPREVFMGADTNAIRTVAEFQARLHTLPAGTELHWYSGCFRYTFVPVGTNRIPMKEFRTMCGKAGVDFSYSCGF